MAKLLNTFFSVWTWCGVVSMATLSWCLQVLLAPVTWPLDRRRRITGRLLRLAAVASARISPLWRFRVSGPIPESLPERIVVVSNHESQADPFLISHLPWEMKWLSKASLFKVPILGWAMWMAGDIPVRRGERASAAEAMDRCRAIVESGMPVMIFPEGTRSPTGEMLPFKEGAFRLAIQSGASILPIAVHGTRQALPKHSWRVGKSRALVAVGKPISTQGMSLEDVPRLSEEARRQILELRARLATS